MKLLGKELRIVVTSAWEGSTPPEQVNYFVQVLRRLIEKYPYDMYVVEHLEGKLQVRLAGYPLEGTGDLNETKVIYTEDTKPFKTFWQKTDDQGDFWSMTILFPEDY